ncbi:hypothetical protein ABT097_28125 [Streptomyces sp. NPDC002225]|uniref:hypothetical protein n=1 Tax=Streptomyces sp. NPDC002225 TaxID=3154413 RepID=UPI003332C55C
MPSPYEHLLTAEELLGHARRLLDEERPRTAAAYARIATAFLEAASARDRIIPELVDVPSARLGPLPEWCGNCDGPDASLRWIEVAHPGEERPRLAKCPDCHPAAARRAAPPEDDDLTGRSTACDGLRSPLAAAGSEDLSHLESSAPVSPPA